MARKYIRNVVASRSAFIDPLGCNSTISYKVIDGSARTWGSVLLSDCEKRIEWYFSNSDRESTKKIDTAIVILEEFREAFIKAKAERLSRARAKRKVKALAK